MDILESYSNTELSMDEMYDISAGLVIVVAGVALVLTAKGLAMGAAAVAAAYAAGLAIGQGLAYIKK